MGWDTNEVVTNALAQLGAPPQTLDELVKSSDWNWFLRTWAQDQGDNTVHAGSNFLSELWNNMDWQYLEQMYVQDGATMRFEALSPELAERVHNLANDMAWDDSDERLRQEAYDFTYALVDQWTSTFLADIQELQSAGETVSGLQAPGLTRDRIDRAVVDNYNDQVLKGMDKGDWTTFEQSGDIVFLEPAAFDSFAPGYRAWITSQDDYRTGNLGMVQKGRGLDPGELKVVGTRDTDDFKRALRAVTKKKLTFQ
jgi:hypothetical protein